jgi:CHAT domain-containing protein/tetratricopeptide (TPR) repeat protein
VRTLFVSLLLGFAAIAIMYGQNSTDSARFLFGESRKAIDAGDFLQSEVLLERILELEFQLSDYQIALVHNNLGFAYSQLGRLEDAIAQYKLAERLLPTTGSSSHQLRISILINQASYHRTLGDYSQSLQYNNEAFRLLNLIPEWDALSYNKLSTLLLNRGITLYHLGRYEEALTDLKECEQIKIRHNHPYLGSVYFNLARVHQSLGDLDATGENYVRSIDQWISEYDPTYYELANIYLHFGQFLAARGQPEEGFGYLNKALENYRQNYGVMHPLTAACYESLARFSLDRGSWEEALDYLQWALQSMVGDFQGEDPFHNPEVKSSGHDLTFLKILASKALVLEQASGDFTKPIDKTKYLEAALGTNQMAIGVLDQIQNPFLSAESRLQLNAQQKDLFVTGIRLNLELFDLSGDQEQVENAFLMAARGKSRELMFEMNEKEWLYLESLPDTVALKATELKQKNHHLSNLIQIENLAMNPDSARMLDLQDQLFQTTDSFFKQMEQLQQDFPEISRFESTHTEFSLQQIRRNLKRNETLVEYFLPEAGQRGSNPLYIFVVTKDQCHYYQGSVDREFQQHLLTLTNNLHGFVPYAETPERFSGLKHALYGLYQEIFLPIESHLKTRNLIVVPDEGLSYVPFDALITHPDTDSIENYAGIPYLLYDYNISYMYNSQLIRHKHPRVWNIPEVIAWIPGHVADPSMGAGYLQGAEEEVREILEITNGRRIRESLEKPELMAVLEENSIIHLAMHSLALENTGISPYFILDSIRDPLLGNRMHDYEINALNLSSPMVVLSSCETAAGRLHKGEGIMSLSRSFLQAGAASVVHSLWPVEDAKSREIMAGFYRELSRGHSKSRALAEVKKQYIAENPPFYTHPYYWAAFQITGDISPLRDRRQAYMVLGFVLVASLILYGAKRRSFFRRD